MRRLYIFMLILLLLLSGCAAQDEPALQRLTLSVTQDDTAFRHFPAEYFQGNSGSFLRYNGVASVEITLDGESHPLDDAILNGLVDPEEIRAWAAIDARNGICKLDTHSRNGLSHFIYRYPDICDLYFCQDIYETPDGKQHIFNQFAIYPWNEAPEIYFIDGYEDENGDKHNLDEENWGLTFEIQNLSPSGFDLIITQRSGTNRYYASQHLGQLILSGYTVLAMMDPVPESLQNLYVRSFTADISIENNAKTSVSIHFDELEGFPDTMPGGRYKLLLDISDQFNEDQVHPLMRDYQRYQNYSIYFEIP